MAEVSRGMTRREVKRLLGKPTDKITTRQFLRSYSSVVSFGGVLGRSEAWLYVNVPKTGSSTFVMFERGRVTEVQVRQ
ncbi:MAG TPA: hypothetical protein VE172_12425 [Stackebrandtia sp.]|jgi:hypothetical protein|uniref:hypothetical protein n=1 Tax=Stackebrandtia sp. TaxID=2023065 RepID=UPI002D23EC34|nr:hypothetical protein [Stackebrandtia sp.]HZE39607.1 hypothetical protein [Stackebrandtia sp.]